MHLYNYSWPTQYRGICWKGHRICVKLSSNELRPLLDNLDKGLYFTSCTETFKDNKLFQKVILNIRENNIHEIHDIFF